MIAVALGLISVVVMVATGVVVSSSGEDRLTFLGIGVETTTAQVFVTGAIFAGVFIAALWLLRIGMQRSGARCAELAGRWAGLSFADQEQSGFADDEPGGIADPGSYGSEGPAGVGDGGFGLAGFGSTGMRLAGPGLVTVDLSRLDLAALGPAVGGRPALDGLRGDSGADLDSGVTGVGGTGPAGDRGAAPWRRHGGPDLTDLAVTPAGDQSRALSPDSPLRPSAWIVGGAAAAVGIRVGRRGQRSEVGGRAGPVSRENGRADRERRPRVRGD
jgi:hypothetical protein